VCNRNSEGNESSGNNVNKGGSRGSTACESCENNKVNGYNGGSEKIYCGFSRQRDQRPEVIATVK